MIRKKTVFILGAGSSMPYGFESGSRMLIECKKMQPDQIARAICFPNVSTVVKSFLEALQSAQNESLDAFLEHRTDSDAEMHIGKRLIASRLLYQEMKSNQAFDVNGDWISYLYSRMVERAKSIEDFQKNNPVTFITYNYDRLVEHRFSHALQSQFKAPLSTCAAVFKDIPVIHLHGSLGKLYPEGADGTGVVAFGANSKDDRDFNRNISFAIENGPISIKIVHQANPDTPEFVAARKAMSTADRIYYLGFGFGQTNVERLDFGTSIKALKFS